jgi:hypothetical protein
VRPQEIGDAAREVAHAAANAAMKAGARHE